MQSSLLVPYKLRHRVLKLLTQRHTAKQECKTQFNKVSIQNTLLRIITINGVATRLIGKVRQTQNKVKSVVTGERGRGHKEMLASRQFGCGTSG